MSASTANGYNYSPEYKRHIIDKSQLWLEVSARCKERAGHRCQMCNAQPRFLHAHHRTYDRLEKEGELDDLIALCKTCHEIFNKHKRPRNPEVLAAFGEISKWLNADPQHHRVEIQTDPFFAVLKIHSKTGSHGPIKAPNLKEHISASIELVRALGRHGPP